MHSFLAACCLPGAPGAPDAAIAALSPAATALPHFEGETDIGMQPCWSACCAKQILAVPQNAHSAAPCRWHSACRPCCRQRCWSHERPAPWRTASSCCWDWAGRAARAAAATVQHAARPGGCCQRRDPGEQLPSVKLSSCSLGRLLPYCARADAGPPPQSAGRARLYPGHARHSQRRTHRRLLQDPLTGCQACTSIVLALDTRAAVGPASPPTAAAPRQVS